MLKMVTGYWRDFTQLYRRAKSRPLETNSATKNRDYNLVLTDVRVHCTGRGEKPSRWVKKATVGAEGCREHKGWRRTDWSDISEADRYKPVVITDMEAEGSGSKVSDTSTAPTASSLAANGSTPGTPETTSTLTQKEILRERYLKGVKKRKCTVCGNTARARSSNPNLKLNSFCPVFIAKKSTVLC